MNALRTDLYELRMAASYLRRGMHCPATFSLFARKLPVDRGFLVCAGLADALTLLQQFRFDPDEIGYLRTGFGFADDDLEALARTRFTGDVWAVPEGRIVFASEPLLEVTAPIAQAQLVETALLNLLTFQTTIVTKATRCRQAAGTAELIDFAYRRTHGLEAGDAVARVSAIAGFDATGNVAVARRYGLRPAGTMAHSYVEAFPTELAAFAAFADDFPEATVFVVDTYDTLAGVRHSIDIIKSFGYDHPTGIRLDSGDLAELAVRARDLLDQAGLVRTRIIASGGLDEYAIAELRARHAPIDVYGVGTKMGVSADAPSLDSAYKLVAYADRGVMKLSTGKATWPGAKQVFRSRDPALDDLLALRDEPPPRGYQPLLEPVMRDGERVRPVLDPAVEIRQAHSRLEADLRQLPAAALWLRNPQPGLMRPTQRLLELRDHLQRALTHAQPRAA